MRNLGIEPPILSKPSEYSFECDWRGDRGHSKRRLSFGAAPSHRGVENRGRTPRFSNGHYDSGLFSGSFASPLVRRNGADCSLASAGWRERVHCVFGGLHASGMSNSLASKCRSVHVPVPWRRLLCRWDGGIGTAAPASLSISGARPGWPGSNPDEPAADCLREEVERRVPRNVEARVGLV